ncbi:MAG: pyridoxal-phosphate dependent enzyme [Flavobacteriaceae bacterium]|nr:pyridoxal-phosphate dependent enzyme [Flavobacteriaceae bacterium]
MLLENKQSENQLVQFSGIKRADISLFIKREDLLHPTISGNKYRKLRYNIEEARNLNHKTLLTFGGAYSNHIAAVAAAGKEFDFKTIGIIRGDEFAFNIENTLQTNPTFRFSAEQNMRLEFVSRKIYREKDTTPFYDFLKEKFGDFYLIPEGGTNELAVKGIEEILNKEDENFDYLAVSMGTGGTISGLVKSSFQHQKVLGFSSLKADFFGDAINKFTSKKNFEIFNNYHFGKYGKVTEELIIFINKFKNETSIPLDPIYTGKMIFGIVDLINQNYFEKNAKILAIHTGGLQGIEGMNTVLLKKNLPIII